jgi:hypothetical protein
MRYLVSSLQVDIDYLNSCYESRFLHYDLVLGRSYPHRSRAVDGVELAADS